MTRTYLLDVNALVALGFREHEAHERVARWVRKLQGQGAARLATCAITELGLIRVLTRAQPYRVEVAQAKALLAGLKQGKRVQFTFLADDQDASRLPSGVRLARQITDGHLAQLAKEKGAVLATLEARVAEAFVIPG